MEYDFMSLGQYFCIQDCLNIVFLQCTVLSTSWKDFVPNFVIF